MSSEHLIDESVDVFHIDGEELRSVAGGRLLLVLVDDVRDIREVRQGVFLLAH